MTLKIYIGTADEITARLAGAPNSTVATITSVTSDRVFDLDYTTSFSVGDSVVVDKNKGIIESIVSNTVTLEKALPVTPTGGNTVKHYNADYTKYRDISTPFTFIDDIKTGGQTGEYYGQDLVLLDHDGLMANVIEQNRISIFDDVDAVTPLFAGVIVASERIKISHIGTVDVYSSVIQAKGYQWEADSVGIEESPFTNVNSGTLLEYLMNRWTSLTAGEIDLVNSPRLDYVRLSSARRFSDIGRDLASLWPGSEFYIRNDHTGGKVYFRQRTSTTAPISLDAVNVNKVGFRQDQYIKTRKDYDKVYNIVSYPFYKEQYREPDYHQQAITSNEAFLKSSVVLAGQPTALEESLLLFDDFSDGDLNSDFTEDDLTNSAPPDGFTGSDGYLVEGQVNQVGGLHFLDTSAHSPAVKFGDIGRITDPGEVEPFTGEERQLIYAQEIVVNALGDAIIGGVIDQTTVQTTTISGSTTSRVYVSSVTGFVAEDRIEVNSQKTYVTGVGANYLDVSPNVTAPASGVTVSKHRLALSRVKFGLLFKSTGDLKYILNGVETAFSTPRVYTASPSTYSVRIFMQCFSATISGSPTSTGCTLLDATNFATGDVVDIFTQGERSVPETRVVTVSGSNLTYAETNSVPSAGYTVKTKPKIVVQIKGGSEYGAITGRDWTTIHTAQNTWQTSTTAPDDFGVILAMHKSIEATITNFWMKDPVPITGVVDGRYLHIGTQEVDSTEADVDCIVRKVGSHYQLDFFPDTKNLWASGSTLELRYKERWRLHLDAKDTVSMSDLAKSRGYTVSPGDNEQTLIRLGGRAMEALQILPTPLSEFEAINQANAILSAVKDPAFTVEILTNTVLHNLCQAGQTISSSLTGVPNVEIKRVSITEIPGVKDTSNRSVYKQVILAGSVDRLSEILQKNAISAGARLIIDDGVSDDSYTKLVTATFTDTATNTELFDVSECSNPTTVVYDGASYSAIRCLKIA